jgi:acetoacetyl-CoA synthetase
VIWRPDRDRVEASRLADFADHLAAGGVDTGDRDYQALHGWSVNNLATFWEQVAEFFGVEFSRPPSAVLSRTEMPGAEWFQGAELSYAAHVFAGRPDDGVAIVCAGEDRPPRELTWAELQASTAQVAAALRALGVVRGDRVAAYLPNGPEAVALLLASASLGATFASCSPDFGSAAAVDRLAQLEPSVLVAVDGYRYGGRAFDRRPVVREMAGSIASLRATVLLSELYDDGIDGTVAWETFLASGDDRPLTFEPVPFDHPLWVLFSSGTTGLPKGLVHSHGGILLEHLRWLGLQVDLGPEDRLLWLTTTGWTMWNFLVGGLLTGTTIVQLDGNPAYPDLGAVWRLIETTGVTCFGAGASFYSSCRKADLSPGMDHDLTRLRSIGSTGSPLHPEDYDWIYDSVAENAWLFSTSGGTDVCTAFVGGSPWLPVRRGEIQAPALGVDVQAWDADGGQVTTGEVGELVVTRPMPSMPVRLWGDGDGSRYRDAYFDMFPGAWRHGDWIEMTPSGGAIIHGRSDATINRGGIRIGSAEIYRVLATMAEVADAVVVDVPDSQGDTTVLLFAALADGRLLDERLEAAIRGRLRDECSPRHVPNEIIQAPEVPRTLSGKVLETPIRRLLRGADPQAVASRGALSNPEAFDWFVQYAAQRARRL